MLEWLWNYVAGVGVWAAAVTWHLVKRPEVGIPLLLALIRSVGTTVQTGWAGVLFSWGRARKVLEPGFHPVLPVLQAVRQTPIRSVTLDLPRQRVVTADELVFEVHANIVYRVEDPLRALTLIDDVTQGILTLVPLLVHEILREQTAETVSRRQQLDAELTERSRAALARWGLAVEQAGFATIAPTARTVRLSQLPERVRERLRVFQALEREACGDTLAACLASPGTGPRGRNHAGYHRRQRPG